VALASDPIFLVPSSTTAEKREVLPSRVSLRFVVVATEVRATQQLLAARVF